MYQGNKIVIRKEVERQREKYEQRLKSTKSVVDSSPPQSLIKRITRAKKIQLMEGKTHLEKCTEIERENRILYEKILKIRSKTPPPHHPQPQKSLNQTSRKLKLKHINNANSFLTKRLENKESEYKTERNSTEKKETEKIFTSISEISAQITTRKHSNKKTSGKKNSRKLSPLTINLVHRQGKIFNNKSLLIEIYKNSDNYRITAFDLDSPDKFYLIISVSEAVEICGESGDLRKVVSRLDIEDNNLIIKPRGVDEGF
ncbi:hypothetical protein SteCoe_3496 [Stentor coeruleus]|uniref:Uncharacterized protein n=1 Tax=Stentor coeruleus TaxID=5963 RepID=A0A1R2CX15_9CILI|nr:hypothetical protein SteCoe_3496 [Stentor coeruleus]